VRLSFVVPFHRGLSCLARCLRALDPLPPDSELIIVADGAVDDCRELAARHRARVVAVEARSGPAVARNTAAAAATGDVLVFVDADVVVSGAGLARVAQIFRDRPQTAAVFGSYDDEPADPGFMSQYKNLSHSFIHRSSGVNARTFWAGFGAVRRDAFQKVGGFDERFDRPSVEDIDLGYRLNAAGYEVMLDPTLSACHLKRWTVRSVIVSDVRDRGIPWTQLLLRYGVLTNDLNLRIEYRWSVLLAYAGLTSLGLALYDWRFLTGMPLVMAALTVLNQRYYRYFYRKRGTSFAVRVWALHAFHHLYNGVSLAAGTMLFIAARYLNLQLPGALSTSSWTAIRSQSASTDGRATVWSTDPA
jgi:GT2 family glycosyltransferase